jgi:hypothetical protein
VSKHISFKGTVSRDFGPSVFSLNGTPGSPDPWAKAVYRYRFELAEKLDYKSRLLAMPHSAESIFLDNAKLKILIYCHEADKIGCYFKGFCNGRKDFVSTPRYAA